MRERNATGRPSILARTFLFNICRMGKSLMRTLSIEVGSRSLCIHTVGGKRLTTIATVDIATQSVIEISSKTYDCKKQSSESQSGT